MKTMTAMFTAPLRALAAYGLYRWWNTAPRHRHIGVHRAGRRPTGGAR